MTVKNKMADRILYAIVVWCIFSFKVTLVDVAGESAIRPDDILIFIAFLFLLFSGDLRKIKRSRSFNIYLGFIALSLCSAVWNSALGRVDLALALFFVVRPVEYMVFYYLGYSIARSDSRISRILSYYLALLCLLVPLQMWGLLPVLGNFTGITSRAVGNTNGPYELAAVAAFLLCYLGYSRGKKTRGIWSFLLILLSASRITFVATAFSLAKVMLQRFQSRLGLIVGVAFLAAVGGVGIVAATYISSSPSDLQLGVFGRVSGATSSFSLDTLSVAYNATPVYRTSADYIAGEFVNASLDVATVIGTGQGDTSGLLRVYRWTSLIKSALDSFGTVVLGLGPSFGSAAVDGYFVRLFIETGVLGLMAFCWFAETLLSKAEGSSWPFREYVLVLLATACFIDIFVSYKPMLLLWLWHGIHQFKSRKIIHENRLPNEG